MEQLAEVQPPEFKPATPEELNEMSQAGFSDEQVHEFRLKSMQEMVGAGFSKEEVQKYYGALEPDMSAEKDFFKNNIEAHKNSEKNEDGARDPDKPIVASTIMEALEAGWDQSVTGLGGISGTRPGGKKQTLFTGKAPDVMLPADAPRAARIAAQVGQLAGDLPAMVTGWFGGAATGAVVGGAAGSVVPGVGTLGGIAVGATVGGASGAFAAPAGMRKLLMDHYEKGDIKDFADFWDRSSAALWEATKAGGVGAVTGAAGMVAGKALGSMAPAVRGAGTAATEIATMVSVGKAIEGEMPNADDFIDATIVIGGLHGITRANKFRNIYEKTGLKPETAMEMAQKDIVIRQEILSDNVDLPTSMEKVAENPRFVIKERAQPEITRSEAEQTILQKVGVQPEKVNQPYRARDAYKDFVDKLDPIKELEEAGVGKKESGELPVADSPYKLARMVNDHKAKAKYTFEKGTIDYKTLEKNGKGLSEILEPHKNDINGLKAFMVAERAIEIEASGRKTGFDLKAAEQVVKEGRGKYAETAKELVEFQRRNLQYLRDSGRIDQRAYEAMLSKGEKYIPFTRIIEDVEAGGTGRGNALKELKGSEKDIQDPFLSMVENTEKIFKMAEVNRAMRSAVEFNEKYNLGSLEKVEVKDRALRKNEIEIWRDGKREIYQGQENLVESLKSLEGNAPIQNVFFKMARWLTGIKRVGITLTPDFILKNAIRDQLTAGVFSKQGTIPFSDMLVAAGDVFKNNEHYYNWLKSGGANGAFLELNAKYIENNIYKLDQQTGILKQMTNNISRPWEIFGVIKGLAEQAGNIIESAPRLAEFKRTSRKLGTMEGGFASREITVDFQRIGAKMSALNAITAFQNVNIQGLDRMIRAAKENPTDIAAKTAAYIVAPSVLLWWAQHDDERYKQIPDYKKVTGWPVLTDKWERVNDPDEIAGLPEHLIRETKGGWEVNRGTIYWIPKPQGLGLAGSMVEMALDKFVADNPTSAAALGESIRDLIIPSLIPDAITPVAEHATGMNFFTKRPLVPEYLEKQLPAYRYTEYTTETSKALGKLLGGIPGVQEQYGTSPMVIENYVRGWTGTLGMYALQLADAGLIATDIAKDPVKPAWTLADIPAVKAFVVRYPSAQAQAIQDFYEQQKSTDMVVRTLKDQLKKGESEEVEFLLSEYDDKIQNLQGYKDALTKQSSFIHAVQRQEDWTPEEKRQLIDTTYYQMIEIAKQGLEMSREMERALKEK